LNCQSVSLDPSQVQIVRRSVPDAAATLAAAGIAPVLARIYAG
jgi:hypothetical protein